jgi:galactan endo-1,6-beta-galactosidase
MAQFSLQAWLLCCISLSFYSLAATLATVPRAAAATITITIDPTSNWGTWEGWGTSLAWWAKKFGSRDDLADIFFTLKWTTLSGKSLPGLGLNIARYNAGACSWNKVGSDAMVVSSNMKTARQMEGFWLDWNNADPTSSGWDWGVDATQRAMLQKASQRGANHLELFSNSPMWWMCKNHNPAGGDSGGDNLQTWNVNQHAQYLAAIAARAKANWGVTFESVEPFNEPRANWWKKDGTQEGCHFDAASQVPVLAALRSELNSRGLSSTLISSSDENTYDDALATWNALPASARSNINRVNVHGYQNGNGKRDGLYSAVHGAGKKLWNSEYGSGDATGKELASNLILDFRWLHPTAWVYWQVLDGGGWGLLDADLDSGSIKGVNQKYWVLAQFSRHIREGMRILDPGAANVVAAYDAARSKLVIVAANWGDAQYIDFELDKFSSPGKDGAKVLRWNTMISSGDQYKDFTDTAMSGTKFWSWFEKNSVQTFEVDNVKL